MQSDFERTCALLDGIAERLRRARSHWDGAEVDGEMAYFAALDEAAAAIEEATSAARKP